MKKRELNKQLQTDGFKKVPYCSLWLKANGTAYNTDTNKTAKPRTITTAGKEWKTEKVILWLFKGVAPRNGQITYIDGNAANKHADNLQYSSIYETLPHETINADNLRTAIRCYISIDRKAKPQASDINTRLFLWNIYKVRDFATRHGHKPYFSVFRAWIAEKDITQQKEPQQHENLKARERNAITAHFLNLFTAEICREYEAGALELQPYNETARERRAKETELLHRYGMKRPRPVPLRLPSEIVRGFERLGVECVEMPNFEKVKQLRPKVKLLIWLNRCIEILQAVEIAYPEKAGGAVELIKQIEKHIGKLNIFE